MGTKVLDFHIHYLPYEVLRPSVAEMVHKTQGRPQEEVGRIYGSCQGMEGLLAENGVDIGVILAEDCPITSGYLSNEEIGRICSGSSKLIPFASLNPFTTPDLAGDLERLAELGFKGVKLYPTYQYFYANDRMVYPLYKVAEKLGMPVMVHTGSSIFKGARIKYGDPVYLDDVAVDFPKLNILMVHCGRGFWHDSAFFLSRLHANLYMEIAGLPPAKLLDYFPELERNADKIIFGSDWPSVTSIAANIQSVRSLPLREESIDKILWGNAARLLGMV